MAKHIKNIACPKCRENGEDRQGDNLASYSDGSCYCWKCHHFIPGTDSIGKFLSKGNSPATDIPVRLIQLPRDACIDYPQKAMSWIEQYELSRQDLLNNHVVWSESNERLIFPFWNGDELLGWQGRYFGNDPEKIRKNKWWSQGKLQDIYHIFFLGKGRTDVPSWKNEGRTVMERHKTQSLVLVEDVVSALKVSKLGVHAMPIFGVNVKSRWHQIRVINPLETILWLDPDQYIKMIKECRVARLNGFKCHILLSKYDPKCHSLEEIQTYLGKS